MKQGSTKMKQCINCKYADKPNINSACNDKVKSISDIVPMKYSENNMPYCDGFKQAYKVNKHGK